MVKKTYQRFVKKRLINLGCNSQAATAISSRFQHQIDHMGQEGACTFLKRIGDQLLWYVFRTGQPVKWVAKTGSGFPKFLIELRSAPLEILIRISKFARVIRLDSPSAKQVEKVVSGVLKPYGGSQDALDRVTELIIRGARHYQFDKLGDFPSQSSDRLVNHYTDTMTVSANNSQLTGTKVPPLLDSLSIVRNTPVLQVAGFESVFWPIVPSSLHQLLDATPLSGPSPVGEIHATQEGGCKLRMFAAPFTVVQCILSPIHDFVAKARKCIPTDYTYSQLDGALVVQQHLKLGTVWSYDLTTATCRFPLVPQLQLLRFMGVPEDYLDALHWASRGDWRVGQEIKESFGHTTLAWKTGQPLGLRPSMSMFSTAHNCLLAGISLEQGVNPETSFVVLGDDVAIFEERVAQSYSTILGGIDVPISTQKSHISDVIAEFAGATITRSCIIRPGQWRQANFFNAISLAKDLGTPLHGEVIPKVIKCQQLSLFMDGLFDPPLNEWSWYIKASSLLQERGTDLFQSPRVPSLIDGAYSLFNGILTEVYPGVPVMFEKNQEDFVDAAFRPLLDRGLDVDHISSFAQESHDSYFWVHGTSPAHVLADEAIHFAQSHVLMAWSSGELDSSDVQKLNSAIIAEVVSLLFVPPKLSNPQRMLREQIERLFHAVNVEMSKDFYPYPSYIRTNDGSMVPDVIVDYFFQRQREHESFVFA